jgi:hypothetical protein
LHEFKRQEIKVQEIRDESMMWNAMGMRHETRRVSSMSEIEISNKMHSKTIISCKKSKPTSLTKSDKRTWNLMQKLKLD